MDDTYQTYLNRVARLLQPTAYQSQLQHIRESPKFQPLPDGTRGAAPFPGYTIITPPWEEDLENSQFYNCLKELQQQLLQQLNPGLIVTIPPDSFHLTLADLIWENAYRERQAESPEYEVQLQQQIAESFNNYQLSKPSGKPISWQLLGLMVMPRAIAVCLAPNNEDSYEQIKRFRRSIYQNRALIGLGVQQQYHLTAHVTLGYFGAIPPDLERDRLSSILSELNIQALPQEAIAFTIRRAELRKFDDMTRYYRQPEWPILEF
ncbi:MAG: DUF1868 domain-containing protein [Symploca sp. SIO1B1]|nr:DUF1868 domain-containing protein [Symploca sp. SIO1B1]